MNDPNRDAKYQMAMTALVRELRFAAEDGSSTPGMLRSAADALEESAFLAAQMRLVISHLRHAAANIPDHCEYWAQLVGQICQIRKGAN